MNNLRNSEAAGKETDGFDLGAWYQLHNTGRIWIYSGTPDRMDGAGQQPVESL
jgi:hypothetical protein